MAVKIELIDVKMDLHFDEIDRSVCRTCLCADASVSLFAEQQQQSLLTALLLVCGVTAAADDGLPPALCERCARLLGAAAALRERAQSADQLLRQHKRETSPAPSEEWLQDWDDEPLLTASKTLHKRVERNRLQCHCCGHHASTPSALRRHQRVHTGERPYACARCPRAFAEKHNLQRHQAVHDSRSARVFVCDTCSRCFKRRDDLVVHLRTHTGARPFPCSYCPARFTQRTAVTRHARSHAGVRAYACDHTDCTKRFTDPALLRKHQLVHSQRRHFICHECGNAFKSKTALNAHSVRHTTASQGAATATAPPHH